MIIHISHAKFYSFNGWTFEYDRNKPFVPWPCKKDLEPRERAGMVFYKMFGEFNSLSIDEQEKLRVL